MKRILSVLLMMVLLLSAVSVSAATTVYGDLNADGKVNNRDLALLQQYLNEWDVAVDPALADVDGDGRANNRDMALLQQYLNEWDVTLGPKTVPFHVTLLDGATGMGLGGVTVIVYVDACDTPAGQAVTSKSGTATIQVPKGTTYEVVLDGLPTGYVVSGDMVFTTTTVQMTATKAMAEKSDHSDAGYQVGMQMYDFVLTDIDGGTHRLSTLLQEKKLVLLNFWFADCPYCRHEFPFFEEVYRQYRTDVEILAINPFDSARVVTSFRNNNGLTFPVTDDSVSLHKGFGVTGYPTTVFITPDGRIVNVSRGAYPTAQALIYEIQQYI